MNENNFEISVVIPLYNEAAKIKLAISSVNEQADGGLKYIKEIIVINDGSQDDSYRSVQALIGKSKVPIHLLNQSNSGVSVARNRGMNVAQGNWIAFLDADDVWEPDKIAVQVKQLMEHDQIDLLGSYYNDQPVRVLFRRIVGLYQVSVLDMLLKSFPSTPTVLMRKQIFEEIGGFDVTQRYAEDTNYFLKIASSYNVFFLAHRMVTLNMDKEVFGESGLSSKLFEMHRGTLKNLKAAFERHDIGALTYLFLRGFYQLKFIRRIIISKQKSWTNRKERSI